MAASGLGSLQVGRSCLYNIMWVSGATCHAISSLAVQ